MQKFFLTGPNRTGTTLLARCISDHPNCICLFESNIHVTAFGGMLTVGHSGRMKRHGFSPEQTRILRDRVQKHDPVSFLQWYDDCAKILGKLYDKPELTHIGDKNPFFHTADEFWGAVIDHRKIWTIRDPRAVWYSGVSQKKPHYFDRYLANVEYFLPRMDDSTLAIRFEDLVNEPAATMKKVYKFLGVSSDESFFNHEPSKYDRRFAWNPNSLQAFDLTPLHKWKTSVIPKKITKMPLVKQIINAFNYK